MSEFKDHYPNNPLVEVGWEIRFPILLKLTKNLDKFQTMIEEDYPIVEFIKDLDVSFNLYEGSTQRNISEVPEFNDVNKLNKIRVLSDRLIFISNDHTNYTELSHQISDVYGKFQTYYKEIGLNINQITRVGLRYINHCPLPSSDAKDFGKFFISPLSNMILDKGLPKGMNIQTTLVKENHLLNIRYGIISTGDSFKYLMDFDAFQQGDIKTSDILGITDTLHQSIREIFISSITDEFISSIMEG